jgi:putative oxidoreductase
MDRYNPIEAVSWGARFPLALLRISAALLFFEHGTQKLFHFPTGGILAPLGSMMWAAGVLEVVGGAMLVAGLFCRPVAFILAGEMACAYWLVHAPRGFYPLLNGGDAAILFCFVFFYIGAVGGGAFSLDSALASRRRWSHVAAGPAKHDNAAHDLLY